MTPRKVMLPPSLHLLSKQAFSLIEMLTVISIVAVISVGAKPALSSMGGAQNLTKSAYDVAGVLEQARTYAMAKNTYVYVGLAEAVENASSVQLASGGGRLVVGVMCSKSGVRPQSMGGAGMVAISRLQTFDNVKLSASGTEGSLGSRRTGAEVVSLAEGSTSTFSGLVWSGAGGAQVTFDKVIEFDSAGTARFTDKENIDGWIEIPMKSMRGNDLNEVALQVDGVTGTVQVYRP